MFYLYEQTVNNLTNPNLTLMKRITLGFSFFLLCALFSPKAEAQYYFYNDQYYDKDIIYEIGGSLNFMNCFTDLGGNKGIGKRFFKDLNTGKTHLSGGAFFSATYRNAIGLRVEGTYGTISADDNVLSGIKDIAEARYNRNLNFRSTIGEISVMAEIHPLYIFANYEESDAYPPRLSPYILGGVGYFSFNPQGKVPNSNRWVDLQPLSTEGQGFPQYADRKPYKLQQVNIPVGGGVRYELSRLFYVRAEAVYRITNTDYLDDVSMSYIDPAAFYANFTGTKAALAESMANKQIIKRTPASGGGKRGSPAEKDAYFSVNIKFSLALGRNKIR